MRLYSDPSPGRTSTENDERQSSDAGSDMGDEENAADFNREEGSARILTAEEGITTSHRWWAIGPACTVGDIGERARGEKGDDDHDMGMEADTIRVMDGILQEIGH